MFMKQDMTKAVQFSNTFRYIDDLLSVNNENFGNYISDIYPSDLELKDTTLTSNEVCYLDTRIRNGDSNTPFHLSVYDREGWLLISDRSIFLIWTATFPPIRPMVFIYLNWWDMLEFAPRSWISYVDFADFHHVSFTKGSNLCFFINRLLNSSNATVLLLRSMALRYGKLDEQSRIERHGRILCYFRSFISS